MSDVSGIASQDVSSLLITDKTSLQIGFFGHLSSSGTHSGTLPFTSWVTNYGDAFTAANGTFRAPVSGLYFLSLTSTPAASDVYPDAYMVKNIVLICDAVSANNDYGQSISCSTVQHLAVGDQVWVESGSNLYQWGTSFSGFLIVAD
jgi:hypothetical protein